MRKQLLVTSACLLMQAASAGTIYKCSEGGKPSYSDRPCGRSAVALAAPPAPADADAAKQRLAREQALLKAIEDERAARARQDALAAQRAERAERTAASQRKRCDKLRLQRQWAMEDSARAGREATQGAEGARIKARRQAQVLAVECPA